MVKMGFERFWVNVIMMCVTSVSYSFMVNRSPCVYFHSKKGLR